MANGARRKDRAILGVHTGAMGAIVAGDLSHPVTSGRASSARPADPALALAYKLR